MLGAEGIYGVGCPRRVQAKTNRSQVQGVQSRLDERAARMMTSTGDYLEIATTFTWNADFQENKIFLRWIDPVELMHSCDETNTYVLGPDIAIKMLEQDLYDELQWDLHQLNGSGVPYGQMVFMSYHSDGVFYLEAATDRFKPHLVEEAFRSFGYTDPKLVENWLTVSEKDRFKLKLRYT